MRCGYFYFGPHSAWFHSRAPALSAELKISRFSWKNVVFFHVLAGPKGSSARSCEDLKFASAARAEVGLPTRGPVLLGGKGGRRGCPAGRAPPRRWEEGSGGGGGLYPLTSPPQA